MRDNRGFSIGRVVVGILVCIGWFFFMNWYMNKLHPNAGKQLFGAEQQVVREQVVSVAPLTATTEAVSATSDDASSAGVSIAPLTATTEATAAGWKMAEVNLDGKKFKIFYFRKKTMVFDWKDKQQISVVYHLKDEATTCGISPDDYGFYVFLGDYDGMHIVAKEHFDKAHYRPDSALQQIILSNEEKEGKKIFRQIFDQLEVIEGPKK